jgi:hypothetical protein
MRINSSDNNGAQRVVQVASSTLRNVRTGGGAERHGGGTFILLPVGRTAWRGYSIGGGVVLHNNSVFFSFSKSQRVLYYSKPSSLRFHPVQCLILAKTSLRFVAGSATIRCGFRCDIEIRRTKPAVAAASATAKLLRNGHQSAASVAEWVEKVHRIV